MEAFAAGPRTTGSRLTERISYDIDVVHAILDEALICHVGFDADGPLVLPMIHARVGDRLYLHTSSGAGLALHAPAEVCVTVSIVDGLVLAKSQFHHSLNSRSVVVRGSAVAVTDPGERAAALAAIVDHVSPGRSGASRPGNAKELAATAVLRVALREVSAKVRSGPPKDEADDLGLPYWSGVVPLRLVAGEPLADEHGAAWPPPVLGTRSR